MSIGKIIISAPDHKLLDKRVQVRKESNRHFTFFVVQLAYTLVE
jgi:hypothetical protein